MEPADIDWKNIESRFIRDETYEHINAPMWLDLSAPDSPSPAADDVWFCRPECRHPKTADDFLKVSPSPKSIKPIRMPLGERKSCGLRDGNANASAINNSLKRRGAIASLLMSSSSPILSSSSPAREPTKNSKGNVKKHREDAENQDPNLLVGNGASNGTSTTSKRPMKTLKEAIKSSAEKKGVVVNQEELRSKKPVPRLRSTLSARNLFSGRDILGQISEFCHEIKKLAVGKEKSSAASREEAEEERKALMEANSKGDDGDGSVNVEIEEEENCKKNGDEKFLSVLKEVRACPPTPQRFPSPSSRRLWSTKPATSASSPLKKPLKPVAAPERGILQELDQGREEKRAAAAAKDKECKRVSSAAAAAAESEGSSMDMFWFLKPCTYLVK